MSSANTKNNLIDNQPQVERVLIVGVHTQDVTDLMFQTLMDEMASLTETAGGKVISRVQQNLERVDSRTLVGKGKLQEIQTLVNSQDIDTVIFLNDLKPIVNRNLEETLNVKVIDRVQLILDIFALRAKSSEGKLQVSLAQYEYLLPRIIGKGKTLSRLGAGIGTRGPGETKLESDRRHIRNNIHRIKEQLKDVEKHRDLTRQNRLQGKDYRIGLIGYTNAGKSTILEQLSGQETYVKDQLFATLDPLTREFEIGGQDLFTITDTVGFIESLPTQLIHAFKSTLQEISHVDLLLHVVDASHPARMIHEQTVKQLIKQLEMDHIPQLTVYNKADLLDQPVEASLFPYVAISAHKEADINKLKQVIKQECQELSQHYDMMLPALQAHQLHKYQQTTLMESLEFDESLNAYHITGYEKNSHNIGGNHHD